MGILLLGGTLLLAAIVWKKVSTPTAETCPGGHIDLKGRGMITESTLDGEILRLTLGKQNGRSEFVLVDVCAGKILGGLTIDSDPTLISE